ncbi:MAG: hypothetical protein KF817_14920 [Phycisphaeraceae bacterium]|nr:hypothetical protein [Phycisphaeraceae bacterium]
MKQKGISFWEQHLERLVLGGAAVVFVGLLGWQLVSAPNSVTEGGTTVRPSEIDDLLTRKAVEINRRLDPLAPPAVQIPEYEAVADAFRNQLMEPASGIDRIAVLQRPIPLLSADLAPVDLVRYRVPVLKPAEPRRPRQYFDTLSTSVVEGYPALRESGFVSDPPYDVTWVTPSAVVDLSQVLAEYAAAGESEAAIPAAWYDGRLDILDVVVDRERLVRGTWGETTTLAIPPGMLGFRDQIAGEVPKSVRDRVMTELRRPGVQDEIVRPSFYETAAGLFTPPTGSDEIDDGATITDEEREIRRLDRRLADLRSRRSQRYQEYLAAGGARNTIPTEPGSLGRPSDPTGAPPAGGGGTTPPPGGGGTGPMPPRGGGSSGGAPGGGGFGGPGGPEGGGRRTGGEGGTGPGQPAQPDVNEAKQARAKREIEQLDRQYLQEQARLEAITGRLAPTQPSGVDVGQELMRASTLVVWAHDITARLGETYRYRFTVRFYNPFFARRLDLLPEQHALAESIALQTPTSAWSHPVEVAPSQRIFVTSVNPAGGDLGYGEAVAEVFRFQAGRWWTQTFRVEPGLQIGAEVRASRRTGRDGTRVDFATGWFLLDVIPDLDADRDAIERGRAARVVLQRLDGDRVVEIDPRRSLADPEREQLQWLVEDADRAEQEVASAAP